MRPGPLKAGMPQMYAKRKNGKEKAVEPLPNTWDIVENSLGTICYQEQLMLIAQRVAKFDDNQSDTYLRKAVAKKKKDKMELCRQWFIYGKVNQKAPKGYDENNKNQVMYDPEGKYGISILGGVNNGYKEKDLIEFWNDMQNYATYLFNLSHSSDYSFITLCTMYLKCYYTSKFFAALLTMQDKQEKIDKYIRVAREMKIIIKAPDINLSQEDFIEKDNVIYFGLGAIKGVGASSIPEIIKNRPYNSLEDLLDKVPKKFVNKRVGEALIKTGAFDEFEKNRHTLLNQFYDLRKDKKVERLCENDYTNQTCIEFETSKLGTPITCLPYWQSIKDQSPVVESVKIIDIKEKKDKRGHLMCFATGIVKNCVVELIIFSSVYVKNSSRIKKDNVIKFVGKKDKEKFIIKNCA